MIYKVEKYDSAENVAYIIANASQTSTLGLESKEADYVAKSLENKDLVSVNQYSRYCYFVKLDSTVSIEEQREKLRMAGCRISDELNAKRCSSLNIVDLSENGMYSFLAEGIELSNYRFDKYKAEKKNISAVGVL